MDPQQPEHTHCKCALAGAIQPSLVVTTSGAGAEQHTQTELRTHLQSEVSPCLGPADPQRERRTPAPTPSKARWRLSARRTGSASDGMRCQQGGSAREEILTTEVISMLRDL